MGRGWLDGGTGTWPQRWMATLLDWWCPSTYHRTVASADSSTVLVNRRGCKIPDRSNWGTV